MASQSFRRDVVLFLVALILPTTVLVVLGFRMIDQERTLAEARATGELQHAVGQIRQHLLGHLEQIKLEELEALDARAERSRGHAYVYPEVELIARVEDGRVVLPWDGESRGAVVRGLLAAGSFAGWLQQGARAEYRRRDYRTARAPRASGLRPHVAGPHVCERRAGGRILGAVSTTARASSGCRRRARHTVGALRSEAAARYWAR